MIPRISKFVVRGLLQAISLYITGLLLITIFAIQTGLIENMAIFFSVFATSATIIFRYTAIYHQFKRRFYKTILLSIASIAIVVGLVVSSRFLINSLTISDFKDVFHRPSFKFQLESFLPEWWSAIILILAGIFILVGSILTRDFKPYPKPTEFRTVASSPVYFAFVCAFFGLWAVLFVGINIQRIIIIAPIFEELLKFGIALLIGSTLFGRSQSARIGIAIVVGSSFGLIEHSTTYPTEMDALHVFRTIFHMSTTVLSVSIYTYFESKDEAKLCWIAPAFPIILHFFYNTFAVISGLIIYAVHGSEMPVVSLVYGTIAIFIAVVFVALAIIRHRAITAIHKPLQYVLSDLV
jgi:hypothetical protein